MFTLKNVSDAEKYTELRSCMGAMNIDKDTQDAVFRIVAALLFLGNITFEEEKNVVSTSAPAAAPRTSMIATSTSRPSVIQPSGSNPLLKQSVRS